MITTLRYSRRYRGLLFLGICLLILAAIPVRPAKASLISQAVDNSLTEFTRGTFQRTSLGTIRVPSSVGKVVDQTGAVQLLPIGVLKQWFDSPFLLQEKVTDAATVALGNRIFVIGGTVSVNNVLANTAHVWSAAVDQTTGAVISPGWQAEPNLPAVQVSTNASIHTVAPRAVAAAVAVQTDAATNSGYIYVLGGDVRPDNAPDSISSIAVNIARVVNGRIDLSYAPATNGWATGPSIPSPDGNAANQLGMEKASAVIFTTGGKTYIYLLGGLQRYREGPNTREVGLKKVFYAQVNSNGQLSKPSGGTGTDAVWGMLSDIPVSSSLGLFAGLWDATAVADHFENGSSGGGGDVLYMAGGQFVSAIAPIASAVAYNNSIYRALIGSNGVLTWTSASGSNQWQGTLPKARVSMATVQFRGKLYMTGGRPIDSDVPQQPQAAVLTSYVEDDLTLPTIGDGGSSNFLSVASALPKPRARHGSVVISATPTADEPAAAFVYVIAGVGDPNDSDQSDNNGSDTVIYGKIGGNESTEQIGFASSGWYYSKPHDTVFDGAQVQEINWTTVITRTGPAMDIRMDYRTSTASNCDDPNAFNGVNWQTLDGTSGDATTFSANGANSVTLPTGATANCFQYRARLTSAGSPPAISPSLLNVSIVVQVPGNPDLKIQTLKETKNLAGKFTGLNIVIQNQSIPPPTQPADIEGGGSFFVDLFVFGPGQTPVTPTLPLGSNPPGDVACVNINKSQMPADGTLSILQWYDTQTCSSAQKAYNTIFSTAGHYVVIVAVDTACPERSYGCVNEGTSGGESNNLRRLEFDIPSGEIGGIPDTYLPILRRGP